MQKREFIGRLLGVAFISILSITSLVFGNGFVYSINFIAEDFFTLRGYYEAQRLLISGNFSLIIGLLLYIISCVVFIIYSYILKKMKFKKITIFMIISMVCALISCIIYLFSSHRPILLILTTVISLPGSIFFIIGLFLSFENGYIDYRLRKNNIVVWFAFIIVLGAAILQCLKPLLINAVDLTWDLSDYENPKIYRSELYSLYKMLDFVIITVPFIGSLFPIFLIFQINELVRYTRAELDLEIEKRAYFIYLVYGLIMLVGLLISFIISIIGIIDYIIIFII